MTQRELAFEGCTAAYISRMEAGHRVPSLEIVRRLAERLAVNEGYLLGREASPAQLQTAEELHAEVAHLLQASDEVESSGGLPDGVALPAAGLEREARARLSAGDGEGAVELLREALARSEERPASALRLRTLLARALVQVGREADAMPILDELVGGRPTLRLRERARDEWDLAKKLREEQRPAVAERHLLRAQALADAVHEALAAADAAQILAGLPAARTRADLVEILDGVIGLLDAVGEHESALVVKVVLAGALLDRDERSRAEALAAEVAASLESTSASGSTRLLAGDLFVRLGDEDRALAGYRFAIASLEPLAASEALRRAYRQTAALLKKRGQMEEAFALLERALDTEKSAGEAAKVAAEEGSPVPGLVEA